MNIPLTFGHYEGRSLAANAMILENMYVEPDQQGGSAPYSLNGTPGCSVFVETTRKGQARGACALPSMILCVIRDTVYEVHTDGTYDVAGTLSTKSGYVQFAVGPDYVLLIDGTYGYSYKRESGYLARITDADFPTPLACTWKDGYFVVVNANSGQLYVSAINDATDWDALDFTTAEFKPDDLVGVIASHDSLFAFGSDSTQAYYNSGNSSYPFDNRQGANMLIGCGATNSPAVGNNVVFWLDNHGVVRMLAGYEQRRVSTPQIDNKIRRLSSMSDATGHCYTQNGHVFYVLTFPTDALTLVYDVTTQQWHKRTSYPDSGRYRPAWIVQNGTDVFAGDYANGIIYKLDLDVYTDNSQPVRWFATAQDINSDNKMIQHDMLEVQIESGVGLESGDDPQIWIQYSDDNGNSWSHEKWKSMGKVGEYSRRVRWYALGQSRSRIYRVGGSSLVKRHITSVHLEGKVLGY